VNFYVFYVREKKVTPRSTKKTLTKEENMEEILFVVDTFSTRDLLRFGWLSFEDELRAFTTVGILVRRSDFEQFKSSFSKTRHPRSMSLLIVCVDVIIFRRPEDGRVISGDSEYGSHVDVLPSVDAFFRTLKVSPS
jgi:hypothetical protein